MSKATTVVDENISDGLIVNKHDDTDTTKDAEEAETQEETTDNTDQEEVEKENTESAPRRPSIQEHLKNAANKTSSLFSWTVMAAKKKVEDAKVASQPHLTKLQENSKLFAAKTQEAAKNAAEVINETVQVTRERANSALSKENQAKFRERARSFQEQSAASIKSAGMNVATSAKVAAKVTQEKVNQGVAAVKSGVHNISKRMSKRQQYGQELDITEVSL
eukprot:g7061.t1